MRPLTRITPRLPAKAYKTYQIISPPDTSERTACELAGCRAYQIGWQTTVDESTPLGREQADYIRTRSGRTFREQRTGEGLTAFWFEAKQRCFADHRTRPELYLVRGGDFRGNPTRRRRRHESAADWVEDFALHQQGLADLRAKG